MDNSFLGSRSQLRTRHADKPSELFPSYCNDLFLPKLSSDEPDNGGFLSP